MPDVRDVVKGTCLHSQSIHFRFHLTPISFLNYLSLQVGIQARLIMRIMMHRDMHECENG